MFFLFDWVSILFLRFIMIISSIIFIYSVGYIDGEIYIGRFLMLILLFILSMLLMILSPNVVRILFGWDGLGLVSYCLVIYYQNYFSYNSGMVTVLRNRIGDVGLLITIGIATMYGSWNQWILGSSVEWVFILLAALTKRAQLPFSAWLPMAIAAPTPVSALVHSSTLVTAGVYLLIRYRDIVFREKRSNYLLIVISVTTMFMAGLIAVFENDLKKIIALSTLSQLGLIIMCLGLGLKILSFYHLLIHALFKSLLFICAGIIIHLIYNNQDIRKLGCLRNRAPYTLIRFYIANLALCGFPFLSGFYSKDIIIEIVYLKEINLGILFIITISLGFTVIYSYRLFYYIFFNEIKRTRFILICEGGEIRVSLLILVISRIIRGRLLNWLFFYDFYIPYILFSIKIVTVIICMGRLVWCSLIMRLRYKIFNVCYNYLKRFVVEGIFYFRSIWFLGSLIRRVYKPIILIRVRFSEGDKSWLEISRRGVLFYYIIEYRKFKLNRYKMNLVVRFSVIIIIFIYLII